MSLYLRLQSAIVKMEEEDSDTPMDESNVEDTSSAQENTVDSTVNTEEEGEENQITWKGNALSCACAD